MMNQTIIIVILIVIILCIEFGQGLRCYQHDYCLGRCPTLISSTVQCKPGLDKCWKFTSPLGTMRGCGDHRCKIQLDTGIFDTASVCCSSDLCNSSIQMKITTIFIILSSLIAFIYV
ncbi:unnamed protein product [Rotaria sordida]|uniref:Uncharacterized protein n=1 Tax=Rotaria sordida TaxID=392033 RepID=A0A814KDU6_9BILA|nr:unnamed protein product [Rotaria sordida]CAF1090795.1 unnamed protein product [Rotaria sordida]CAF1162682.1 unnamed protein product [Rotaria sordida]CAF1179738.1 unnamed protein product [Rotaria sordida]CAF1291452.1 unnamed protein product [Rotaria sordida]